MTLDNDVFAARTIDRPGSTPKHAVRLIASTVTPHFLGMTVERLKRQIGPNNFSQPNDRESRNTSRPFGRGSSC
jgi:hypothetical protein